MKKILLIIAIAFVIFQMVVLATEIIMGDNAINDSSSLSSGYTYILKNNPANDTGKITNVDIWAAINISNIYVAIFTEVDTNIFTARDREYIASITAGSKVSTPVDLDVVTGDYIGIFFLAVGSIDAAAAGAGRWWKTGDQTECVDATFAWDDLFRISLAGQGATEEEEANAISFGTNF